MGDFNCKEINWEERTYQGGENSSSDKLTNWTVDNLMTQWIDCEARITGRDKPSRLELLFTSAEDIIETTNYECPLGKSDRILIEISLSTEILKIDAGYKLERYRYNKANFEELRRYFKAVSWKCFEDEKDVQEKWNVFIKIYNSVVEKYVPKGRVICKKGEWYNAICFKYSEISRMFFLLFEDDLQGFRVL